ncbi:MAG: S1 family peptidase, partial [Gammaproteobacteria bacterium]|nr:S1 family peptidase [Gammaproteobacteria bacterium]
AGVASVTRAFAETIHDAHVRAPKSTEVALGVAQGKRKRDFVPSARIQVTRGAKALAATIVDRSRGECDVRIVPKIIKRQPPISFFRRRQRPLEAGLSIGVVIPGIAHAGTLGFVVEDRDAYYVLSNNHVLADVNNSSPGDPVTQPGNLDRRASRSTLIGVLDRYVPISFQRSNVVDCAVAEIFPDLEFWFGWTEALPGVIRGIRRISVDDLGRTVRKAGRTTGVTQGVITSVEVDRLRVNMGTEADPMIAQFSDQIEVTGTDGQTFSTSGDSGSLIVDTTGRAVGLLFAGGEDENGVDFTYANRIDTVLSKLGVSLVH